MAQVGPAVSEKDVFVPAMWASMWLLPALAWVLAGLPEACAPVLACSASCMSTSASDAGSCPEAEGCGSECEAVGADGSTVLHVRALRKWPDGERGGKPKGSPEACQLVLGPAPAALVRKRCGEAAGTWRWAVGLRAGLRKRVDLEGVPFASGVFMSASSA